MGVKNGIEKAKPRDDADPSASSWVTWCFVMERFDFFMERFPVRHVANPVLSCGS